ncbi:hypothetical protein IJI55_01930 [Candidatus Saccharibacteria bacterium]|nr:hypothetical protein [Candidatus Saccharibacteria bacterium]
MQFDEEFLDKVGLSDLPKDKKESFLASLQGELEMRVGHKMSEGMSDAKLLEFDELSQSGDTEAIQMWIRTERPDYREIARDELEKLTEEIIFRRDEILANA